MNRSIHVLSCAARFVAAGVLISSLSSCSLFTVTDRPAQVHDLVGWVERVHVESELAKQKMHNALRGLRQIVTTEYDGTAVSAYAAFMIALEESEKQAQKLRDTIAPMKQSAGPVFEQWAEDLEQFSSAAMRKRSLERMTQTQEQYNNVVAAIEPAQTTYDVVNRGLRDHALFLGNDLNPASVAMVRDDVNELITLAKELDGQLDRCLVAAEEYVNDYSLPVGAATDPAGVPAAPPPGRSRSPKSPIRR